MSHFLGIDLGASALKACLVSATGLLSGQARAAIATHHPHPGHAEQNPADWCAAMKRALSDLRRDKPKEFADIQAVSFSGGAHIGVLCDADDRPLRAAIMWSDTRAEEEAADLQSTGKILDITGNMPNPTWTLPQLIWLSKHEAEIIAATQKLYFAKDWLAAQLTGRHVSDKTEAVGSLMATPHGQWSRDLTAMSGLPDGAFPEIAALGAPVGQVTQAAADTFGLPHVPVYQGAIDTSMEWLCTAPLSEKAGSLKLASAGVISVTTRQSVSLPPISYYPHLSDGIAYHAAGMSDCMGAIDFMRAQLTPSLSPEAFERAAAKTPIGAEGVLFYPYLSGARAPFWDARLSASLSGLTRAHGQGALARAAYEGVGHVLTAIWHDMKGRLPDMPDRLHILGGGGESDFFCQMLADMLNLTILRGQHTDCAFATAIFAAACHQGQSLEHMAAAAYRARGEFQPDKTNHAVYASGYERFMARHSNAP